MWIHPSSDVHLFLAPDLPRVQELRVFGTDDYYYQSVQGVWMNLGTDPTFTMTLEAKHFRPSSHEPGPTSSLPASGGALTVSSAEEPGAIIFKATVQRGAYPTRFHLIRVTTHTDVVQLLAGQPTRTLFAGRRDRVLTVFACVTTPGDPALPSIVDISGHACLRYTVGDANVVTVDPDGRIVAVGPGTTDVVISLADGRNWGETVRTTVHVLPALDQQTIRGEPVWTSIAATRRVFFIAEGYQDPARFRAHAKELADKWLTEGTNRPYNYLRNRFECIGIFFPSHDQGITVAGPLVRGADDDDTGAHTWKAWAPPNEMSPPPWEHHISRERDTSFGLRWSSRPSRLLAPRWEADDRIERDFFSPDDERSPLFDERCLEPMFSGSAFTALDPRASLREFLEALVRTTGNELDANDRMVFLVDDSYPGGVWQRDSFSDLPSSGDTVALSWGREWGFRDVDASGTLIDRDVNERGRDAKYTGSRLAHEMAHTFQLGDEYEDRNRVRTYQTQATGTLRMLEVYYNVHVDSELNATFDEADFSSYRPLRQGSQPGVGTLNRYKIKWNFHRIRRISQVDTIVQTSGPDARATLQSRQYTRWSPGDLVCLRKRLVVTSPDVPTFPRPMEAEIISIEAPLGDVTLRLAEPWDAARLGSQPLMYLPVRNGQGEPVELIDAAVMDHLVAHGPFPKRFECDARPDDANLADSPLSLIRFRGHRGYATIPS